MSEKKPLKNENGKIIPFNVNEYIPVTHGGTSRNLLSDDHSILGNGTGPVKLIKNNFNAINNPTNSDDVRNGYSVSSRWIDKYNHIEYVCIDNTENNAIWIISGNSGGGIQGPQGKQGDQGHQGHQGEQLTYLMVLTCGLAV